ncbi:odorant receptor 10a isoform X2 [Drosophila novamexicana]|uniref:odorant receptor 10a isoform X2 n=1 Tax=Drosophila novamexicana TaxID=47314 RepID=UPI0011E5E284|nr:odorant receptor 10a isoform X2 [Drosophila novamexicana]
MAGYFGFRFLYRNQPLSLYYYAVPRLCLNLMGFWPGPLQWRALVHFVVLAIGVATELHAGFSFARAGKITMALETFCPAGTSAVTLLKMFFMLRYRQDLLYVLTHQRQLLFQKKPLSVEKKQLMRRHSEMAARFNFWPLSAGFFTCTMYNLKPILLAMLLYLQGRSDAIAWSTTPFNMTMPRWLLHAPYFPLTYMFIAYTGYVTIFMFGGCDAFYFEFCVHTATLFNFLQADTRALFRPYKGLAQMIGLRSTRFEASLVQLIERHNKIFELTHFFRQRYAIITLAHFVSASMVIGFSIFNLLTVGGSGLGTLLYVGYTVAALSQLVIYCYGGTLVTESSAQLATVMSTCPWHLCLPKHRLYVYLFIMRSQRALTMAVPFFSPSLGTFAAILQTSGSIIALAKSFQT